MKGSVINTYKSMGLLLFEVRMTQTQRGEEAEEILRGPNMLGANKKRAVKAIKRAEKGGPKPLSHERIRSADRGGFTNSRILKLPKTAGVRAVAGLTALQLRAYKQRNLRGGIQNIPKLARDMKKDPSTIPPIVTSKKDKPGEGGRRVADKEAIEGGRSRAATALAINTKPDAVTVPQDRHTGSAKRYVKARLSGKLKGKENLPGQDPRLQKMSDGKLKNLKFEQEIKDMKESIINTYRNIGAILAEAKKAKKAKKYTPPRGYRLQTPKEEEEVRRITHSRFAKAPYEDAHSAPRHADGRRKTESIVNSYRDLGYLLAEIRSGPEDSEEVPKKVPKKVPGMFTGKFKKLQAWLKGKRNKKPKAWSDEERAEQLKNPKKKATLDDAVRQATPYNPSSPDKPSSPEQDALNRANRAIDQRDRRKRGPTNRGGIDPNL